MSIKRLKFFQEMLHKLLLYLGKIRFALPYFFDQKKIQQRPKVSFSFNHDRLTNYLAVGKALIM